MSGIALIVKYPIVASKFNLSSIFIVTKQGTRKTPTVKIAINMFYMSHKKNDTSSIDGATPECMDEIANNAINTDASSQIDILLDDETI